MHKLISQQVTIKIPQISTEAFDHSSMEILPGY